MSTETQVDLDWAGMDAAQGGAGVSPVTVANHETGTTYLTDEEILGLEPAGVESIRSSPVILSEAKNLSSIDTPSDGQTQRDSSGATRPQNDNRPDAVPGPTQESAPNARGADMPAWMAAAAADPRNAAEAHELWREHQEFRAAFASAEEARAVKELLPGGLRDALSLREATQSIERIDAALFSGDARAQAEVVAEIARANPAAFRTLFAEAAKVLAGSSTGSRETGRTETAGTGAGNFNRSVSSDASAGPTLRTNREGWGIREPEAGGSSLVVGNSDATGQPYSVQPPGSSVQDSTSHQSPVTSHPSSAADGLRASQSQAFDPSAYAAFERATNDAVARDVRGSIHDTLARALPEGVAEGAARRIGEDIFQEVHRALAADRALSEQVAGVLGARRFGGAEQQRVASLLAGRARQLVPGVARRVIGEWTSTVLSTARTKAARQAAAAARVDIASPGGSLDSMPLRSRAAGSGREVNYDAMSDEQILGI